MKRLLVLTLISLLVLVSFSAPVIAGGPKVLPATPVVDPELPHDYDVPGIAIQRGDGFVYIRLNRGDHQAHINVILQGATITDIWDHPDGAVGLEDPVIPSAPDPDDDILEGDGSYGGCSDDAQIDFGAGHIAKAQLYTCGVHDGFFLALDYDKPGASDRAIKIVFTKQSDNISDDVWISNSGVTYGKNDWIPLE